MQPAVSIIIPNYNGRKLLEKNLPSVVVAALLFGNAEIIVVDDFSTDDSRAWLAESYSEKVKSVLPEKNLGFSGAIMEGVRAASADIVYFLNSDIRVEPDFLASIPSHFSDEKVFAVSSLAYDGTGAKIAAARAGLMWKWGMPDVDRDVKNSPEGLKPGPTLFASGGHSAYRKKTFLELGGFNHLFSPFYFEDVDLCYTAWKQGFKILFEPSSIVYHDHQGTIASVAKKKDIEIILRCNRLLLTWKNITSWRLSLRHTLLLPIYMLLTPATGAKGGVAALLKASSRRKLALQQKENFRKSETITDERLFTMLSESIKPADKTVCYFGSYNINYPRVEVISEGLLKNGMGIKYCHVPPGKLYKTWPRLALKFISGCRDCSLILVGQGRHMDAPIAKLLGLLFGKTVILDAFISHYNTVVEDYKSCVPGSMKSLIYATYDRIGVAFSDHVLLDTSSHIDYYCEKYSLPHRKFSKVLVGAQERIYNPLAISNHSSPKFIVLFFGSFMKLHGIEAILHAADILKNESNIEFRFVGGGPSAKDVEKLNSSLALTNTVFYPLTDYTGIVEHIGACHISLGIFSANQKAMMVIPNKIFNSIAMKKTVITASTPGVKELFEDRNNIVLCEPENSRSLADTIMELKNNPTLMNRVAENGYALFLEKCLPEQVVSPLVEIINNV